jgi:outer membrane protein TolC
VTQLDAQITRLEALERSGAANKVDVMRLQAARSEAEQGQLEAEDGQAQAEDALALILGLPAGSHIETVDDLPTVLSPPPWTEEEALQQVVAHRPELRVAEYQAEQAEGAVTIQKADYLPQLTAVANYTHVEGQGPFAEKDAAYVGLSLKWNLWDWGSNRADVRAAEATARQANLAAHRAVDTAVVDVRAKVRTAESKYKQLAVAKQGADTAEEAYKLMNLRFEGGAAVTTDVIDAEAEVKRGRLAYANARYEYAVALVNLARAIGAQPLSGLDAHAPRGK